MVKRVLYFYFITLSFSSLGWASVQLPTPELTLSGAIDIRLSFLTDEANKNREIETRRTSSFRALKQNLVDSLSEAGSVGNTVMRVNEESPPVYIPMTEYILKRWPEVVAKNKDLFNELELKDIEQEWNDTKVPSAERVAKTLPFIGTDRGFRILNEMGDYYLERGDLGEASRVFHFLKNASVPQSISPAERKKVLQKIEYISQQSEDISSSDIEELSHLKEEIVSGAQKAAELISSCPELKAQFSSKDLIPLSPPLAVRDRIYIVMKDQHQGLYLMTLDRKTKKLLQKQLIGSKEGSWLYPFQDILPYKLLLEQGKIILLTEAGLHEFSLNGTLFKVTDLSDRKQREDTEERRRSQNIFTQYMIKTYGEDYEALAPQFSIDHDLSIARKGYLALPKKEVFPWILEKVREGYDYDIYFDLLDQAGGIPEEQLIEMMKDSNEEVFSFIQRHIAK
ncbi:MAG: hypothetical protein HYW85_05780, partial [Deltaproteobacteria bacterium]|nr:hypothetical protein [Deltaproteobacteria bacterium]